MEDFNQNHLLQNDKKDYFIGTVVESSGPGVNFMWKYKNIHELHENHSTPPEWQHYKYLNNKYRNVGHEIIHKTFINVAVNA